MPAVSHARQIAFASIAANAGSLGPYYETLRTTAEGMQRSRPVSASR